MVLNVKLELYEQCSARASVVSASCDLVNPCNLREYPKFIIGQRVPGISQVFSVGNFIYRSVERIERSFYLYLAAIQLRSFEIYEYAEETIRLCLTELKTAGLFILIFIMVTTLQSYKTSKFKL